MGMGFSLLPLAYRLVYGESMARSGEIGLTKGFFGVCWGAIRANHDAPCSWGILSAGYRVVHSRFSRRSTIPDRTGTRSSYNLLLLMKAVAPAFIAASLYRPFS